MLDFLFNLTFKDYLIIIASVILLISIIRVRKLKKAIVEKVIKELIPEIGLTAEGDVYREFYLQNYSSAIATNIRIQNIEVDMDDFGFSIPLKVEFEKINSLNPSDKIKLNYKIFSRGSEITSDVKYTYINHILFKDFDCHIYYENIAKNHFCSHNVNRKGKLSVSQITQITQK